MNRLRPARFPDDLPAIRALFTEYADSLGIDLAFQDLAHELATLPGDYAPPRGALLLAEHGSVIAGCVALRPIDAEVCEMKRLFVRPTLRGARWGRMLAEAILTEARRIGYSRIRLDTLPSMTEAHVLYERLGFTDIPPYRHNPVPGARFLERSLIAGE